MTVINRAKFHHFPAKDIKVIDGGQTPQADSVLKRPAEIGLKQGWVKAEVLRRGFGRCHQPYILENFNHTPVPFSFEVLPSPSLWV